MFGQTQRQKVKQLLENQFTFATTLIIVILDHYGTDALNWEIDTLLQNFKEDFNADIPRENIDKIQAAIIVLTTDRFYTDVDAFNHVANTLGDNGPDFATFDPAHVDECTWSVIETSLFDEQTMPPDTIFSEEVRRYIGMLIEDEGMLSPPDSLKFAIMPNDPFAETESDSIMYKAMFDRTANDKEAVDLYVIDRLSRLGKELESLPLKVGDTKALRKTANHILKSVAS